MPDAVHRELASGRDDAAAARRRRCPTSCRRPRRATFVDCAVRAAATRHLVSSCKPRDAGGSFGLEWTPVDESAVVYVLEEGTDPAELGRARDDLRGARAGGPSSTAGPSAPTSTASAPSAGPNASAWSNGVAVGAARPGRRSCVDADDRYRAGVLLAVQRALLRMCAARGDLLAVLSLPEHYRAPTPSPCRRSRRPAGSGTPTSAADGSGSTGRSGSAPLYHPWLVRRAIRAAVRTCRLVAARRRGGGRHRRRAPHARRLGRAGQRARSRDVVALVAARAAHDALAALQDAQVNVVRQEPGGFLCLCRGHARPATPTLRPINVRRLLSLLRRLALREGAAYVFEPNDPTFRRGVERGFAEVLQLAVRASARSPARTRGRGVPGRRRRPAEHRRRASTPGRLIVELEFAPSRPLAFLIVRLVHAGERGFALEAR